MKNIIGTKEAFIEMLKMENVHKVLGLSAPTVSNWRRALKGKGNMKPTIDKMEEMLTKYGAVVANEKSWLLPAMCINMLINIY
jgi:hypothetical protein